MPCGVAPLSRPNVSASKSKHDVLNTWDILFASIQDNGACINESTYLLPEDLWGIVTVSMVENSGRYDVQL